MNNLAKMLVPSPTEKQKLDAVNSELLVKINQQIRETSLKETTWCEFRIWYWWGPIPWYTDYIVTIFSIGYLFGIRDEFSRYIYKDGLESLTINESKQINRVFNYLLSEQPSSFWNLFR